MSSLRQAYRSVAHPERTPFVRLATDDGTPFGNTEANQDYSDTGLGVTRFWVQPDPNQFLRILSINVIVSDAGAPAWNAYGNLPAALENGIRIFLDINGQLSYGVTTIKTNVDLATIASLETLTEYANNTRVISYRKPYGAFSDGFPITPVKGITRVGLELNDDLTGLLQHHAVFDGYQQVLSVATYAWAAILVALPFMPVVAGGGI